MPEGRGDSDEDPTGELGDLRSALSGPEGAEQGEAEEREADARGSERTGAHLFNLRKGAGQGTGNWGVRPRLAGAVNVGSVRDGTRSARNGAGAFELGGEGLALMLELVGEGLAFTFLLGGEGLAFTFELGGEGLALMEFAATSPKSSLSSL